MKQISNCKINKFENLKVLYFARKYSKSIEVVMTDEFYLIMLKPIRSFHHSESYKQNLKKNISNKVPNLSNYSSSK